MKETCETCVHFFQHYVRWEKVYRKTPSGHCIHPRIKLRKTETPACERYQPKEE